jgi:hypothetical protein
MLYPFAEPARGRAGSLRAKEPIECLKHATRESTAPVPVRSCAGKTHQEPKPLVDQKEVTHQIVKEQSLITPQARQRFARRNKKSQRALAAMAGPAETGQFYALPGSCQRWPAALQLVPPIGTRTGKNCPVGTFYPAQGACGRPSAHIASWPALLGVAETTEWERNA